MPTRKPKRAEAPDDPIRERLDALTIALRIIAGVLIVGMAYMLSSLLVPFALALFVTIALAPVGTWLERRLHLPRAGASLCCLLLVVVLIATVAGLVLFQAGTIIRDSEEYLDRFGTLMADLSRRTGGDRLMESLGVIKQTDPTQRPGGTVPDAVETRPAGSTDEPEPVEVGADGVGMQVFYTEFLRRNLRAAGQWVATGIGGLIGFGVGLVVFLAFTFYMLTTRDEWIDRLRNSLARVDVRMRQEDLQRVRTQIVVYVGYLALVSVTYTVFLSVAFWLIGLPQPVLWAVLTGVLEPIPYFGPMIAAGMTTVVALSLGTWWQPAAVLGVYAVLNVVESYVVAPLLYGHAVRINPVTVIFGILFFGLLWGPIGLMTAMPMMILLRGLVMMSPDTPALDAFIESDKLVEREKEEAEHAKR